MITALSANTDVSGATGVTGLVAQSIVTGSLDELYPKPFRACTVNR